MMKYALLVVVVAAFVSSDGQTSNHNAHQGQSFQALKSSSLVSSQKVSPSTQAFTAFNQKAKPSLPSTSFSPSNSFPQNTVAKSSSSSAPIQSAHAPSSASQSSSTSYEAPAAAETTEQESGNEGYYYYYYPVQQVQNEKTDLFAGKEDLDITTIAIIGLVVIGVGLLAAGLMSGSSGITIGRYLSPITNMPMDDMMEIATNVYDALRKDYK